ncbi:MAG TPA: phosphodiester glycosidase family protein [Caulobacteraceae bacterium]|nr:phosphodiester glycosidase family protein [Caulobacteraceae bacterium]
MAGLKGFEAATGTTLAVRYGGLFWIPVSETTPWLPAPVRLALHRPPPAARAGPFAWRAAGPGLEIGEMPVLAGAIEADRIELVRIDPARYRFVVRNDPTGRRGLDAWRADLGAAVVINGSYYGRDGRPATPVVIDGRPAGPSDYQARQGAFVASRGGARLVDLSDQDWRRALSGAEAAMVSYPLLLAADGSSRAPPGTGWLANRSFVAEDRQGRIVLGSTRGAFFSLDRLAAFLRASPLDLKLALDLDGGPVACQAVDVGPVHRRTCGAWELQVDKAGHAKVLPPSWPGHQPSMPMVLAVYPRTAAAGAD